MGDDDWVPTATSSAVTLGMRAESEQCGQNDREAVAIDEITDFKAIFVRETNGLASQGQKKCLNVFADKKGLHIHMAAVVRGREYIYREIG